MTEARSSWRLLGFRQIMNVDRPIVDLPWWSEWGSRLKVKNIIYTKNGGGGDDGDGDDADDAADDDDDDDDDDDF